jgi:hypothetical protein
MNPAHEYPGAARRGSVVAMTLDQDKRLLSTANFALVPNQLGVDGGESAKTLPGKQ